MSLDRDIALLRRVPTFGLLMPEALRILAISAERKLLAEGDVLFSAGEKADAGYVVVTGQINLVEARAGKTRVVHEARRGALVGETALIIDMARPVTAVAASSTVLMRIPRATFLRMLEGFPEAAITLRKAFAERLKDTIQSLDGVRGKLEEGRRR